MSQWVKTSVPQWGIKLWSLANQTSIITTRPPRNCYIHTSKEKACPHAFLNTLLVCGVHTGHQMSQWVRTLVPQQRIESWSLTIWVSVTTARPPRHLTIVLGKQSQSFLHYTSSLCIVHFTVKTILVASPEIVNKLFMDRILCGRLLSSELALFIFRV